MTLNLEIKPKVSVCKREFGWSFLHKKESFVAQMMFAFRAMLRLNQCRLFGGNGIFEKVALTRRLVFL